METKIQNIKAKHIRAGYKTVNNQGQPVRIKLIKRIDGAYLITFETGAKAVLMADETLPVTFQAGR